MTTSTPTLGQAAAPTIKAAEFTIAGAVLADVVSTVTKAAGKGGFNVAVLTFRDQRLTVAATDELSITSKVPVKGKKSVTFGVEATLLARFAKAIGSEDTVTLATTADGFRMTSGELTYLLPYVFDYPIIAILDDGVEHTDLDLAAFARVVRMTGACASTDGERPILTGILFTGDQAVATDSYRMAVFPADTLVPAAAAKMAVKVFNADEAITWAITEKRHLVLRSETKVVDIRLIDGTFPNWTQLIRKGNQYAVTVDRAQLIYSLDKVRVVRMGAAVAKIEVDATEMRISAKTEEESANDTIELTSGSVDVPTIGVNPDYLAQMLKAVDGDTVQLGYVDSLKPINVTGDDGSWRMLIMPVRIPDTVASIAPAPAAETTDPA